MRVWDGFFGQICSLSTLHHRCEAPYADAIDFWGTHPVGEAHVGAMIHAIVISGIPRMPLSVLSAVQVQTYRL